MPPDYPEDIVSLIVDAVADARREDTIIQALRVFNGKLDNDDHNHNSGLLSCALVSRDFLRRTRFQLYSNPEIRAQDRLAQFARTTGQSPELASLVQSLRIILPEDITDDEVPALSHAAKQMVNFRKLVIYPHTVMPGQIFRPASLVRTLSAFSACASMQTILLRWWQFSSCTALVEALQLFCQHRGLRHLSLSSSGIDDPDTPLSLQGDSPGPLGLQEVTLGANHCTERILPLFGSNLRKLSIGHPVYPRRGNWKGISALTGLRTLVLSTSELEWPVMDVIPLVRARGLRQLTLKYQHRATVTGGGDTANPSALLARLDKMLSGPAFSALEVFTFHVYASAKESDDGHERWSKEGDSHLPLCRQRGILVFRVSKLTI